MVVVKTMEWIKAESKSFASGSLSFYIRLDAYSVFVGFSTDWQDQ